MAYTFNFQSQHRYDTTQIGITIPIELIYNEQIVQVNAKLDTGASVCVFQRLYAKVLGIDVENGIPELVSTVTGTFQVFGHWLTIATFDFQFDALVYFAADDRITRNVLGRRGWIDQVRLCLIDYDGELYVSRCDDELMDPVKL